MEDSLPIEIIDMILNNHLDAADGTLQNRYVKCGSIVYSHDTHLARDGQPMARNGCCETRKAATAANIKEVLVDTLSRGHKRVVHWIMEYERIVRRKTKTKKTVGSSNDEDWSQMTNCKKRRVNKGNYHELYMQTFPPKGEGRTRRQTTSHVLRMMKLLAEELGCSMLRPCRESMDAPQNLAAERGLLRVLAWLKSHQKDGLWQRNNHWCSSGRAPMAAPGMNGCVDARQAMATWKC